MDKSNGIARLTLNKPPLNIIDIQMMEEIGGALKKFKDDHAIKVIVLAARGKAFSAGTDIEDHYPERAEKMLKNFHANFHTLWSLEQPIVAAVQGVALGGGCELAMACDFIIASEYAEFGQPEIKVGAFAPIASLLLPRIVGRMKANELLLTGESINARQAEGIGLVNQVIPDESFEVGVEEFIGRLAALSGAVLRYAKRAVRLGLGEIEASLEEIEKLYLNDLIRTDDAVEGLNAFLEKREPTWKGR